MQRKALRLTEFAASFLDRDPNDPNDVVAAVPRLAEVQYSNLQFMASGTVGLLVALKER